jgi:SAM-dependent methyltransferase
MSAFSDQVYGVDIDPEKVAEAQRTLPNIYQAPAEQVPFSDGFFQVVLLHEVLEHVSDDRQTAHEACRVTAPGGSIVVFAPNRWYPFETHGIYWRGEYHFGNYALVSYLPSGLRDYFCPHVRTYTETSLRRLWGGTSCHPFLHTQIFPGYDNIAHRHPAFARVLRFVTYSMERTPLRRFGLSHLLVLQKA